MTTGNDPVKTKKMTKMTVLILTLWTLATAGAPGIPAASGTAAVSRGRVNPADDAQLVEKAVMIGIRIIQSSEVAQTKAVDPAILKFAALLVQDHRAANQELMDVAGSAGIPVPTDAYPDNREVMETVNERAGPEFEKNYIRDMVKDHQKAINICKKGISSAESKPLSDFFSRHLTKLQEHLAHARKLEDQTR